MTEATAPEMTPVLIGVGEAVDRPEDLSCALEPLDLIEKAARAAAADAGAKLLSRIDALDVVNCSSWRYADLAGAVANRLGASPGTMQYAPVGGEVPGKLIHAAARRIAAGRSELALVCGAEAQHSAGRFRAENRTPHWTPWAKGAPRGERGEDMVHPLAAALGLFQPVNVYPLYDVASAHAWGQTPEEALAESGEIWSRYARVAADNPASWLKRAYTADEIVSPSEKNRLIAWPYTKLMVANPMVNQGAAVLVASLALARRLGVDESRIVHIHGGAAANEPRDFLVRASLSSSPAQDAVLEAAMGLAPDGFSALELYSCFPCVPKMARRSLGLGPDVQPTVTGGLTFFGAPLSNYMLHAACAMVRRLRGDDGFGLLYGQGEFVTKHHALVLSREAPHATLTQDDYAQAVSDARRAPAPEIVAPEAGAATAETGTLMFERDGSVRHGAVVLRDARGRRTVAKVAADDDETLGALRDRTASIVGRAGRIDEGAGGEAVWRVG